MQSCLVSGVNSVMRDRFLLCSSVFASRAVFNFDSMLAVDCRPNTGLPVKSDTFLTSSMYFLCMLRPQVSTPTQSKLWRSKLYSWITMSRWFFSLRKNHFVSVVVALWMGIWWRMSARFLSSLLLYVWRFCRRMTEKRPFVRIQIIRPWFTTYVPRTRAAAVCRRHTRLLGINQLFEYWRLIFVYSVDQIVVFRVWPLLRRRFLGLVDGRYARRFSN